MDFEVNKEWRKDIPCKEKTFCYVIIFSLRYFIRYVTVFIFSLRYGVTLHNFFVTQCEVLSLMQKKS
jgi:hypothetical protein